MLPHINTNDPQLPRCCGRDTTGARATDPKANTARAVRDFLTIVDLIQGDEKVEESPLSRGPRLAVDLPSLDAAHRAVLKRLTERGIERA